MKAIVLCIVLFFSLCCASQVFAQDAKLAFPAELIPTLNIPHMSKPPVIDGKIGADEWRDATRVMGVVSTSSLNYRDRPISFWVAWDEQHLYIATRTDILPGHRLYKQHRDRITTGVVMDDSFEFGIFMHDRNKKANEVSSFLKMVVNSLGSGEYMKLYPAIGQNMYNWQPNMQIENSIYTMNGTQWWDMEIAMSLADIEMPVPNKVGDKVDLLLAADLKNPDWQWLDFPSASGHLQHYGFPRLTLTDDKPYLQIEEFSGLHDEKLHLRSVIYNPADQPVTVNTKLGIIYNSPPSQPAASRTIVDRVKEYIIPAHGSVRCDDDESFPGLVYEFQPWGASLNTSRYHFEVTPIDQTQPPIYTFTCDFAGTNKDYLKAVPRTTVFDYDMKYNPVSNKLFVAGDTLDAQIPEGSKSAAMTYAVDKDGTVIKEGRITQFVNYKYEDMVTLPTLVSGSYRVTLALVDSNDKVLVSRNDITFAKKDEAKEFAAWWHNNLGDTAKVLQPFTALKVKSGSSVTCTRREYQFDGLGLPRQIISNGGKLLTRPARIIVVVGGKEYVVPSNGKPTFTSTHDWRVEFSGKAMAAGIAFTVNGWMEQDGLVNLALTYAPQAKSVSIDALRVEWPIDDSQGSWMSCIGGTGGNYSARYIGKVPTGQGQVWDTLTNIGKAGSTMLIGNFETNLWVGNEFRGLLWSADSDQGWVPNDKTPAHSVVRNGKEVVICNNIINPAKGDNAFVLSAPRTIQLQYNATPFRNLAKGWRLTQISAANGFAGPDYKTNEKTKQEYFSILSMPSTDVTEWPYYFAKYKARAEEKAKQGYFGISPRLTLFLTNQIALRGYMDKTTEPGLYDYFRADWVPGNESLNKSYADYMMYLMNRHIREGGVTHYYFDISFSRDMSDLISGFGYRLPDGHVQPTSMDGTLREWYKRTWALMQENNLYPGGVSGHATNSICLRALPWTDAILDSEYPMTDPITVYPPDRMIAMSVPHTFGVKIDHLGFMNPNWAAMHDAGVGGGGGVFGSQAFQHFGIAADDVQFIPYWRNSQVVKKIGAGTIAAIWKRPGAAVLEVMNYGLDAEGKEQTRSGEITLDLKALGIPRGVPAEQVRVSEMNVDNGVIPDRYLNFMPWYKALPDSPHPLGWQMKVKLRPAATPVLDIKTGALSGFDIFYHDTRYLLITWDDKPLKKGIVAELFTGTNLTSVLNWGINRPGCKQLSEKEVATTIQNTIGTIPIQAWKQPGTLLLRIANTGTAQTDAKLTLDLAKLGVKVSRLWAQYTQCVGGALDPQTGVLTVKGIAPGKPSIVYIDTY